MSEWFTELLAQASLLDEDRPWIERRLRQGAPYRREVVEWFEIAVERGKEGPGVERISTTALVGLRRLFLKALAADEGRHVWRLYCGELSMARDGVFRIDFEPVVWRTGRLVDVGAGAWRGFREEIERLGYDPVSSVKRWAGIGCASCGKEDKRGLCEECEGRFVVFGW